MSISLGVHVGQQNMAMDEMRALWRKLDSNGVDWISAWDHFYEAPPKGGTEPHFEALATLGALAAETQNARIGCLVFYVGYRNPALLAKAATTLDHISGGRCVLGIGSGWQENEHVAYGIEYLTAGKRLSKLEAEATRLQRANRRWRRLCTTVVVLGSSMLFMGQSAGSKTVQCESLKLVKDGKLRALLSVDKSNQVALSLLKAVVSASASLHGRGSSLRPC